MLENFRTQKIIWDRANKKIFETIEANSGDSNGRKLVVQVINQEVTEVLSGTTLSLGWKSIKGAKGLDAFNVVDASKGIFEIYYTTEMLSNIGDIEASLILIDSTGRIESSTFTISIRPSTVDDESVESENSFTALTEALVKVNDFSTQLAQTEEVLNERVSQTIATAGDGTIPSELTDMRVTASGSVSTTAGDALRKTQTGEAILDNSIKNSHMHSSLILDKANFSSFTVQATNRLYLKKTPITKASKISIEFKALSPATGKVLHLRKASSTTFEIVDTMIISSSTGYNYLETDFITKGGGDEFIGLIGISLTYKNNPIVIGHYQSVSVISDIHQHKTGDIISMLDNTATGQIEIGFNVILSDFALSKKITGVEAELSTTPEKLYTFNDAWTSWLNGEKFPIAFYSDSTTDGVNTTAHVDNVLGADKHSPNAYPKLLEEKLRSATGNNLLRIYNAGFSGMVANWGINNITKEFGAGTAYSDTKMAGIGFGINGRTSFSSEKAYRESFKQSIITMINWFYGNGIQPFLLTTQAILSPDVSSIYATQYPLRDAKTIETIANEVKRELADEFNLELVDVNKFTEKFLTYSSHSAETIISDKLHFGDVGHDYESGLFFTEINPQVVMIKDYEQIDYSNQKLVRGVPEDKVTMLTAPTDTFKVVGNYTKSDTTDSLIFKAYLFNDMKKKMNIKAYKNNVDSLTYVKVDGTNYSLSSLENNIGDFELGLHVLEVYSGASTTVDFKGFKVQ